MDRSLCALSKSKNPPPRPPPAEFISMPGGRFQHIHIDVVGPLPPAQGFSYLLTIVDRYTCWPEAIPVADTSAKTLCSALQFNWVARFGPPLQMTSDRGAQFTSALWARMSEFLGIRLSATTAYHPQANGLVERMHRRLKEALKARLTGPNWLDQLPWVLLGLRTTVKDDLRCSPAELVYGTPIAIPGDCLPTSTAPPPGTQLESLHHTVNGFKAVQTAHNTAPQRPAAPLPPSRHVFVRRDGQRAPLTPAYDGPFKVVKQTDKVVTILKGCTTDTISTERCKPAIVEEGVAMQQPPRRGRPPAAQHTAGSQQPALPAQQQQPLPPAPPRQSQRSVRGVPPARFGHVPDQHQQARHGGKLCSVHTHTQEHT